MFISILLCFCLIGQIKLTKNASKLQPKRKIMTKSVCSKLYFTPVGKILHGQCPCVRDKFHVCEGYPIEFIGIYNKILYFSIQYTLQFLELGLNFLDFMFCRLFIFTSLGLDFRFRALVHVFENYIRTIHLANIKFDQNKFIFFHKCNKNHIAWDLFSLFLAGIITNTIVLSLKKTKFLNL